LFDTTQQDQKLDAIFAALSDATRRLILMHLASGPTSVNDIAAPYAMSLTAVSKHLKVLERAGLVTRERQGRVYLFRVDPEALATGNGWIEHMLGFWNESLENLESYLSTGKGKDAERNNTE
jgi:DNA-binding transcriptional ArsR family regulator